MKELLRAALVVPAVLVRLVVLYVRRRVVLAELVAVVEPVAVELASQYTDM